MKRVYHFITLALLLVWGVGTAWAGGRPFITQWEGKGGELLKIPIKGKYRLVVKDEKGTVLSDKEETTILYTTFLVPRDGVYTVEAGPEGVESMQMSNHDIDLGSCYSLQKVIQFGTVEWTSMEKMFHKCLYMTFADNIDVPNLSKVTNTNKMFFQCTAFNHPIGNWDVSKVTDMGGMFQSCYAFNQSLENWKVGNVTNMNSMFSGCMAFNQPLGSWDVSKVTNMGTMFTNCFVFNQSLANWKVSNVTDMAGMFYKCLRFNQELGNWDVSKVTNMRAMFQGCKAFNHSLANWKVGNVTAMDEMFQDSEAFNQSLSNWDVSKVTNMQSMFQGCGAFNQSLSNWNVSKVTNMKSMFQGCGAFNQSLSNWDVSKVTNMWSMFHGCKAFNQPLANWQVGNVSNMINMFNECAAFNQPLEGWDVSKVTEMSYMFSGCSSFNQSLAAWKIKTVVGSLGKTAMSVENYSKTLVGWAEWAKQADIRDIAFEDNVQGLVYNAKGKAARAELIKRGWSFDGDKELTFEVTLVQPEHGTLAIEGYTTETLKKVSDGTELTVTATTTEEGYELKELQVNGTKLEGKTFTVKADTKVTAVFGKKTFPVTASVKDGKGGEVKLEGAANLDAVEYGTTLTVVATPDEANGYNKLKAVTVNGTPLAEGVMTFVVKEAKTVEVEFALKTFPVTKELKGVTKGEISITGATNLDAVEYGTELTVEATTTEEGYGLKELQVNGTKLEGKTFTVKADTKVTAVFALKTFPVTKELKGVTKGEITITGATNLDAVEYGTELTVEATTTEEGYELKELQVNGKKIEGKTFKVTGEAKVTAVFGLKTFPVTKELKGVTKGEITITGATNLDAVEYGTELTVEATTSEEGYELKELQVNGTKLEGKTFKVTGEAKVTAVFGLKTFPVTKELKGVTKGEITITGATNLDAVEYGTELTVEATTSEEGYELKELQVNGTKLEGTKFKVTGEAKVTAVFEKKNTPPTPPTPPTPQPNPTPDPKPETFEVILTQPEHGRLEIEGYTTETLKAVAKGTELKVKATPKNEGGVTYELKELKANGVDIKGTMKFIVTAATTVTARFEKKQGGEDNKDKDPKKPNAVEDAVLASLSVAPNPFTTQLRILNPEGIVGRYELVNQMGAVLRAGVINGNEVIVDTEALPAGLYFLRLAAQGGARKTLKVYRN